MLKSTNRQIKNKRKYTYLDYAASILANPSSIHSAGVQTKTKLQNARKEVAKVLGARPPEVIFTSGGTESNNLAIQGVVLAWCKEYIGVSYVHRKLLCGSGLPHIITTNIEHPSVLETFRLLRKRKLAQISIVGVEKNGIVDPKKIKKEIKKNTILISVMYANNEIGTIQPIKEIAKEIRHYKKGRDNFLEHGYFSAEKFLVRGSADRQTTRSQVSPKLSLPFFHTDAVQAVNYLDLNVEKLGVDLLSLSGTKIEGAGRIGVLYKRNSVSLANMFGGGDQEMGLRPGTENLPAILQFSKALKLAQKIKKKETLRLTKLRDYFFEELLKLKNKNDFDFLVNGDFKNRLPNNVNITIPKIPSDLLVIELSARGIMASAKSACKAGDGKASYVIKAINPKLKDTDGSLRFSLGRDTTKQDIDYTVKALVEILTKLKKWYN